MAKKASSVTPASLMQGIADKFPIHPDVLRNDPEWRALTKLELRVLGELASYDFARVKTAGFGEAVAHARRFLEAGPHDSPYETLEAVLYRVDDALSEQGHDGAKMRVRYVAQVYATFTTKYLGVQHAC